LQNSKRWFGNSIYSKLEYIYPHSISFSKYLDSWILKEVTTKINQNSFTDIISNILQKNGYAVTHECLAYQNEYTEALVLFVTNCTPKLQMPHTAGCKWDYCVTHKFVSDICWVLVHSVGFGEGRFSGSTSNSEIFCCN
jgi:hypothetical protein